MVDIARLETGFAEWRGENAEQENFALETAKIIANFANTHKLPAIMGINASHLEAFSSAFNASLSGSLAYMKLAIDEHVAQTGQEAPISANEQGLLEAINGNLTVLYNKIITISQPDISYWRIAKEAWGTSREIDQLGASIVLWLDNYALQSINQPSSKALSLSIYTVLKIVRTRLDNLNISPSYLTLLNNTIGIDTRKLRIDNLLAQIAEKIVAFPTPPTPVLIDASMGAADEMDEDEQEQFEEEIIEEEEDEEAAIIEAEAIERDRALDIAFLAAPADEDESQEETLLGASAGEEEVEDEDEFFECIDYSPTPPDIVVDAPPEADEPAEVAEPGLDVFFGPENRPAPPPTLNTHFDASILDILAEEHSLLEKIPRIKAALDVVNTGLTELIRQKNKANTLQAHIENANEIIRTVNRDRATLHALDLINANRLNINALIEQSPALEQDAWRRRIAQIETPTPVVPTRLVGTTRTVVSFVTNMYRRVVPTRAQQIVNGFIPISADEQHKTALKTLAQNRIRAINGRFTSAGQQLTMGELGTLENEMALTINALAGETHSVKALLKHATITELEVLDAANRKVHGLMSAYEGLINHITTTRDRLNSMKGLNTAIDRFILDYDSFFVTVSLFLSHYLSSIFKTDTADKIDKARTMKKEVEKWQSDCQTELNKDIDTIRSNPDISVAVKTEFLNKVTSLLSEAAPPEPAATPLAEDTIIAAPAAEAPDLAVLVADENPVVPALVVAPLHEEAPDRGAILPDEELIAPDPVIVPLDGVALGHPAEAPDEEPVAPDPVIAPLDGVVLDHPAGAPDDEPVVDAEAADTPAAPNLVPAPPLQKPIITAFNTVQTLFNRLAPPTPVTPPALPVIETPEQRVIVM